MGWHHGLKEKEKKIVSLEYICFLVHLDVSEQPPSPVIRASSYHHGHALTNMVD